MSGYSVIILHHNKAAYSRACLESVLRSTARPLQVVNVDNGSTDETASLLAEWAPRARGLGMEVTTLSYPTNIGAVRGRNEAMAVSTGEYLAFLDNDTLLVTPDWLEQLASTLQHNPRCKIAVPRLLFPWEPYLVECCGCSVSPSGRIKYLERGAPRLPLPQPQEIQCAISAAWLMPRALIEEIGVLDEEFSPVQYEDMDLCYRARQAGYTLMTVPQVELFHFEHTTTAGSDDINFKYVTTKNGILFKKRWLETIRGEGGPTDAEAAWQTLPKHTIDEVDWRALLPEHQPLGRAHGTSARAGETA